MRALAVLAVVVAATACGTDDDTVPAVTAPVVTVAGGAVAIVEVIDDVEYYIACANEPIEIAGMTWYPVADWGDETTGELHERITSVERERPARPIGFARVAPPGPGDDVGTLYVYSDGYAWYESDSGQSIWLTTDALEYNWVC